MSLMSTNKSWQRILFFFLFTILVSLFLNLIGRGIIYFRLSLRLKEKKAELEQLEEKNQALKSQLEEVSSEKFIDKEARKLLGLGSTNPLSSSSTSSLAKSPLPSPTPIVNYQKWQKLFGF